ncbi:MAG: hypothetical protein L6Q84_22950 [Polyangiaceae bacterium]|nr:hypothetical protein [Polyangiaceae bacterium]
MSFGKILVAALSVFGLTMAACGGDDGGGGSSTGGASSGGGGGSGATGGGSSGGSGGCGGGGGNTCKEYTDCAQAKCDTEYQECLGAGYKSGSFSGGKCETYMNCVTACNCDTTCTSKCTMDSACQGCMTGTLASCTSSKCSAELQQCAGTGGAGSGGASGGGTCADLEACCNKLSGSDQTNCTTTYNQIKAGGDAACNTLLQTYKSSGKC